MATLSQIVTVFTALASLIPQLVTMVREGQIKTGAYDEIIAAFTAAQDKRVADAKSSTPVDPSLDPNNRDNA